jgi:tetratricopeptide (TPR) repeat protein
MKITRSFSYSALRRLLACIIAVPSIGVTACETAAPSQTPDAETVDTTPDVADLVAPDDGTESDVPEADTLALDTDAGQDALPSPTAEAVLAEGEALFFRALAGETELRQSAIATLKAGLALDPDHGRGQLLYGMANLSAVAEDGDLLAAINGLPALERAIALIPDDPRIPGWLGTVRVGMARAMNNPTILQTAIDDMIAAADAFPEFNNASLAIAFSKLPLDTPYPQMAIDRLLAIAECAADESVCQNTTKVPHNNEGALMLFGDVYARVGDKTSALYYYDLALTSPDAATWTYATVAREEFIDAIDERIARFLDDDPDNDPQFFSEGRYACVGCHAP